MIPSLDTLYEISGNIEGVHSEAVRLEQPFPDFAARFAALPGTTVLLSGGPVDCSRYHILATKPFLSFTGTGREMAIEAGGATHGFRADPFETLRLILKGLALPEADLPTPVAAGLFGYLAYDLKDSLETLPRTSVNDLHLPQICFFAPSIILVQDRWDHTTRLYVPHRKVSGKNTLTDDLAAFHRLSEAPTPEAGGFAGDAHGFTANFSRSGYMNAIERIKEYIVSGHVYQVNLSQRFEMAFTGDGYGLFRTLFEANPAPFFAYINAGDHRIVSTSPERFVQQTGRRVETRPIKGTRPRGETPERDEALARELLESQKDDAELSMIVDLLRNDLGKVCQAGSVRVVRHKRLEAYHNVYHLVTDVAGRLDGDRDAVALIKALFPGGSITGCPKIRAMEIIDELEPHRRHIYTGAIGYVSFHDTMDLSIAIRTATLFDDKIIFSVGGGIVFDSDPCSEYEETLHKGRTLMEVFQDNDGNTAQSGALSWRNGALVPLAAAAIPVRDRGVQFGFGFFETIRVDRGIPGHLAAHMTRFEKAWQALFSTPPPDITWADVIHQVITGNRLTQKTAAVKIMATAGSRERPPYDGTLLVTARPYTHRLDEKGIHGLRLVRYPSPRQTPLADHKTLNYLYYLMAGNWAAARGADEALILNPDGSVSETNTGNILLVENDRVVVPASPHVLPGIMQAAVVDYLAAAGMAVETRQVRPRDLFRAGAVLVTNSLMGAVPALAVDARSLAAPGDLWRTINKAVL